MQNCLLCIKQIFHTVEVDGWHFHIMRMKCNSRLMPSNTRYMQIWIMSAMDFYDSNCECGNNNDFVQKDY